MSIEKYHNYATVVYRSFAPSNWQETLFSLRGVDVEISPLHVHNSHPHFHVILKFNRSKSIVEAVEFIERFGGNGITIIKCVNSWRNYLIKGDWSSEKHG